MADRLDYVLEERKLRQLECPETPPAAPRYMRELLQQLRYQRGPARVQILNALRSRSRPGPLTPKQTWADNVAAKPKETNSPRSATGSKIALKTAPPTVLTRTRD